MGRRFRPAFDKIQWDLWSRRQSMIISVYDFLCDLRFSGAFVWFPYEICRGLQRFFWPPLAAASAKLPPRFVQIWPLDLQTKKHNGGCWWHTLLASSILEPRGKQKKTAGLVFPKLTAMQLLALFQVEQLHPARHPTIQACGLFVCVWWLVSSEILFRHYLWVQVKKLLQLSGISTLTLRTQPPFRSHLIPSTKHISFRAGQWKGSISSNCLVVSSKLLGCCWWDPPRKTLSHLDLFLLRFF